MTDIKGTPGGNVYRRDQLYVDDGDGTHSEVRSANLRVWDTGTLSWRKITAADLTSSGAYVYTTTDLIYNASTALTPKFAFANVAASQTDSAIVAAVTAKKIRVLSLVCVSGSTATTLVFNSKPGGAGAAISMTFQNAGNGGAVLPFNQVGWFQTVSGEGLSATTGAGATTGIQVVYVEV